MYTCVCEHICNLELFIMFSAEGRSICCTCMHDHDVVSHSKDSCGSSEYLMNECMCIANGYSCK